MTFIPVSVRWMIKQDMRTVLEIERRAFSDQDHRWDKATYEFCKSDRNTVGMVAEIREGILGVMVYEFARRTIQVVRLVVDPIYQRCGIGTQFIANMMDKLSKQRRNELLIEVRESNLAAQLFFRSQGFKSVNTVREYYADTGEDAVVMRYALDDQIDWHQIANGQAEVIESFNGVQPATEYIDD